MDSKHLLSRQRLIEKLSDGINYRVMLIHGPAGFGKTSLAMQWREILIEQGHRVAWLSIDSEDNDPERCINYIVGAIHSVEQSIEVNTTSLSEVISSHAIKFILIELINQLETFGDKIYLVLDDWHFIDNPVIHDALNFLIESAPSNFHIIICSRTQPPLPIYTLQVKHQLYVINSMDLRFDESETTNFLLENNSVNLNYEDVHTLWRKTEGWIASLQLILLMLRTQKTGDNFLNVFDNVEKIHSISEYLAENVLQTLPADMLDFLLKTSILERLNGDLCNVVTGRQDSQLLLKQLYKQGMFIRPLDQEQHWFQYHHLFADFLQRRLKRRLPEQINALHLAAAQWFANIDQTAEAVHHAIAAQDIEQAICLVEKDAMWLVEHSFMGTLLRLIDKLPAKNIQMRCELQLAIAWAYCLTHHQQQAQQALDFVEKALATTPHKNEKNILIEAGVLQACIDMYADRLDKVVQSLPSNFDEKAIHNPWVVVVANNIMTYVLIHTYRYTDAVQLQKRSNRLHHQTQGALSSVYGDCFAGIAYLEQGQLHKATQCVKAAQKTAWDEAGKHSHAACLSGALLGQLYYERNQLEEAEIVLTDSRALGAEGGVADFYMATYYYSSRIAVSKNNLSEAYAILAEGQNIAQKLQLPRLDFVLRSELIKLYLLEDNIKSAEHMMQQWHELGMPTQKSGITEHMLDIRACAEARLLCRLGDLVRALELVTTVLQNDIQRHRAYHEISTRTLMAIIMNKSGRYSDAEEMLLPALRLGFEQEVIRSFIDEDKEIIKVIARVAKRCRQDDTMNTSADFNRWLGNMLTLVDLHSEETSMMSIKSITKNNTTQASTKSSKVLIEPLKVLIEPLKDKEVHILKMLEKGLTNKEIARNLNVSVDTVKWYLKAIYTKLGVARRAQAVIEAKALNLLD